MKKLLLILVAAGAALLSPALRADDYPSKPVTLVAVFGPGSASDTICRVIAQPLSLALKESVIVENRPGANGALAAFYVARSAPDGYTLLMGTNSPLSAAPLLMRNLSYDPVKDFEPVSRVGSFTLMLVVNPSLPVKSVKELIDYAKEHPGKLSFASANTSGIVAGETLARLNTELRKIIEHADIKSKLGNVGFEAFSSTSQEFGNFNKVQLGKWGKMVKDAGLQPE